MNGLVYLQLFALFVYIVIITIGLITSLHNKCIRHVISHSVILFLFLFLFGYTLYLRFTMPVINLKGKEFEIVKLNDEYHDEGFELVHLNRKLKNEVVVNNYVNTEKVGVYIVRYSIDYYGNLISVERNVKVVDEEMPIIELKGKNEITLPYGANYVEPGYTATDNYDGDITKKVKVKNNIKSTPGKYEVTYVIEDSSGNTVSKKRVVTRLSKNDGVIYFTFDDGPSSTTTKILDILKREDIKATFFVVYYSKNYENIIRRIVDEGHTIALHSYTHNYKLIYSSEESYFDDLYKIKNMVKETTGIDSNIIRFPGGSSNTISRFNVGIMSRLTKSVKEKGFIYYDWNVDSSDAGTARNSIQVYNNVINGLKPNRSNVVLMHDFGNNQKTVDALSGIIKTARDRGYSFSNITENTPKVVHPINN